MPAEIPSWLPLFLFPTWKHIFGRMGESTSTATWASGNSALYTPDRAYRNGTYYLYYCVPAAKLKDNMFEIDPDTMTQPLNVAEHEFHKGSSVKKINGKYYFLYTDTHRHGGMATSLGYAVSVIPCPALLIRVSSLTTTAATSKPGIIIVPS